MVDGISTLMDLRNAAKSTPRLTDLKAGRKREG